MTTTAKCRYCGVEIEFWDRSGEWIDWVAFSYGEAVRCKIGGKEHQPHTKEDNFTKLYNILKWTK